MLTTKMKLQINEYVVFLLQRAKKLEKDKAAHAAGFNKQLKADRSKVQICLEALSENSEEALAVEFGKDWEQLCVPGSLEDE